MGSLDQIRLRGDDRLGWSDTGGERRNLAQPSVGDGQVGVAGAEQEDARQRRELVGQPPQAAGVERLENDRRVGVGAGRVQAILPQRVDDEARHIDAERRVVGRRLQLGIQAGVPANQVDRFLPGWNLRSRERLAEPAARVEPLDLRQRQIADAPALAHAAVDFFLHEAAGKELTHVGRALQRVVVQADELAVPGHAEVLLHEIGALFDGKPVRGERVLRRVRGRPAVRDERLVLRLSVGQRQRAERQGQDGDPADRRLSGAAFGRCDAVIPVHGWIERVHTAARLCATIERMAKLLLLFILVPATELALLIEVGSRIGTATTLLLIVATGVLGASLASRQGLGVLRQIERETAAGRMPGGAIVDGVLILVAGLVLMTPGFLTDVVGFLCLVPATRRVIRRAVGRRLQRAAREGRARVVVDVRPRPPGGADRDPWPPSLNQ